MIMYCSLRMHTSPKAQAGEAQPLHLFSLAIAAMQSCVMSPAGPSGGMNIGNGMHSENGARLASLHEHSPVLGQVGQQNFGSAKPVIVPLLRLQPSLDEQVWQCLFQLLFPHVNS